MQYDENAEKYGYEGEMTPMKCNELKPCTYDDMIDGDADINIEYYPKSEVDAVLAEKDKEIVELKKQVHDYALGLYVMQARAEKEPRHHKYKRCLAMAEICCEKKENCYNRALRKYSKDEADYLVRKSEFWQDWEFRWLKLAKKFKEEK